MYAKIYIHCIGDTQPGKQKFKQINAKKLKKPTMRIKNCYRKLLKKKAATRE